MSYDAKISPSMIHHLVINKQHQWLSKSYSCQITLNDRRKAVGDLEESTLFFLIQIIGCGRISTYDTEFNVTLVDCAYGKFGPSPEIILTKIFANVIKDDSGSKSKIYTHQLL